MGRIVGWIGLACAVLFPVAVLARAADIPTKAAWAHGEPLIKALVVIGVIGVTHQVVVTIDRSRRKDRSTLDDACQRAAAHIDDAIPGLPLRKVGVHIWRVRGIWKLKRLKRAGQFLLRSRSSSQVVWREAKGVMGIAWKERAPVIVDLETELYAKATSKAAVEAMDPEKRMGLGWDEIQRTKGYKAIYAAPLFGRFKRVGGIIAIDILESDRIDDLYAAIVGNDDFNGILGVCQDALRS